jgi:hypothetical protein
MSDPLDIIIDLDPALGVVTAWNQFCPRIPIETRRRLGRVFMDLLAEHPDERIRELMHGKTVGEVLRQLEHVAGLTPIDSGERDGVKWELFRKPGEDQTA